MEVAVESDRRDYRIAPAEAPTAVVDAGIHATLL